MAWRRRRSGVRPSAVRIPRVPTGYSRGVKVLLTNDDGIAAPGLRALCTTLAQGRDAITVVAPDEDRSGASASIGRLTPGRGVTVRAEANFPVPDVQAFKLSGPPGLAVMTA